MKPPLDARRHGKWKIPVSHDPVRNQSPENFGQAVAKNWTYRTVEMADIPPAGEVVVCGEAFVLGDGVHTVEEILVACLAADAAQGFQR